MQEKVICKLIKSELYYIILKYNKIQLKNFMKFFLYI